jgi:thiamine-phosphate pyrophosphorylase
LVITDRRQAQKPIPDIIEAACTAGCRWFSVREKDLPPDAQLALAGDLQHIARRFGARLMLHGDPELAKDAGLGGVHLPAGGDAAFARARLGRKRLLGISIHSAAEAACLDPALVDYAIAGPVYETASKPGYGPALGPEGVARIVQATAVPILAIGGITPDIVGEMLKSGVAGVSIMGSVMRSRSPGAEVERFIMALGVTATWRETVSPRIHALRDWTFEVHEVSAGVYELQATHLSGASIKLKGADLGSLMERAKESASSMQRDLD